MRLHLLIVVKSIEFNGNACKLNKILDATKLVTPEKENLKFKVRITEIIFRDLFQISYSLTFLSQMCLFCVYAIRHLL